MRCQRSISQPFRRVNVAQTRFPSTRPDDARLLRAAVDLGAHDVLPQRGEQLHASRREAGTRTGRPGKRAARRVAPKRPGDALRRNRRVFPVRDAQRGRGGRCAPHRGARRRALRRERRATRLRACAQGTLPPRASRRPDVGLLQSSPVCSPSRSCSPSEREPCPAAGTTTRSGRTRSARSAASRSRSTSRSS